MQGLWAGSDDGEMEAEVPICLLDTLAAKGRKGIEQCLKGGEASIFLVTSYSQNVPVSQGQREGANEIHQL